MCLAGEHLQDENDGIDLQRLTDAFPKEKDEWEHGALMPLWVTLRDFAARGLPADGRPAAVKDLWDFVAQDLERRGLGNSIEWLKRTFSSQKGILLLDGLDEVPEADKHREQIKQVVEGFVEAYQDCRIVVTSRTYAYQNQDWRLRQDLAHETVIAPFSQKQIAYFVDHWYEYRRQQQSMAASDADAKARQLKQAIARSDRLQKLAERPLLLTLMAALHAWRGGELPKKRIKLYEQTTELLLERWERRKRLPDTAEDQLSSVTEEFGIDTDQLLEIFYQLAFEAHKNQPELRETADIEEDRLFLVLHKQSGKKYLDIDRLIGFLSDRAGLLVARGNEIYTFPHRTFQEYLAACHLVRHKNFPKNIAGLARQDPDRWREVVLLAGAKTDNDGLFWRLVDLLCCREVTVNGLMPEDTWGALFAGQILEESGNLEQSQLDEPDRQTVDRVRTWLVEILTARKPSEETPLPPLERSRAGNLLAVLGDPRPGVGTTEAGLPDIEWCSVPAGTFWMGSDRERDSQAFSDETPRHSVTLDAYDISRYPVTNGQFRLFVLDGGYTEDYKQCWTKKGWDWKRARKIEGPAIFGDAFDSDNHPVVGVSWYEAVAFCQWASRKFQELGEAGVRLPTEAEWEYAARGADGRIYPWGDEIDPELANYSGTELGCTSAVGCFPKGISAFGCEEMAGNVWEWCWDWYAVYTINAQSNPTGRPSGAYRVGRGGCWGFSAGDCRSAYRFRWLRPGDRLDDLGFRVVRT
ncbi:hypothetical protein CSA56_11545 [candidate division KSB3 bacterium]|uniref:Sulfatase-modifying factor enzyme domain-containing protein n=1 Tax=candidate division KSB3 bacterium TaxID=2044937 RepID=A0A2G6KCM0_9BACT|nr:MAG: hypothetical protein CSA56_11545 [candidate division KSB3 bacterium]